MHTSNITTHFLMHPHLPPPGKDHRLELITCDDVLQSSILPLAYLRLHLSLLQLCDQVHLGHLGHHGRLATAQKKSRCNPRN